MPKQISGSEAHPGKQGRSKLVATEDDLQKIHDLAALGKSISIIALRLGVSRSVLDNWLGNNTAAKGDPRVRAAWDAGIALHEDYLTSKLERAIDDDKHKMQIPATMFMLKVKHKWRERDDKVEVTVNKASTKYKTKDLTPDE